MAESTSGWQGSHIGADWAQRVNSCHVSKAMMNKLVMDFLVIEGHKEAAECFQAESGTTAGLDLETISDRRTIRSAIESGDVQRAVAHAHKLSPDLLTGSPELSFHVEQQQLVELIRADRVDEAIAFAQAQLAPKAEQSATLLAELERTMLLLAYPDAASCPEAELLSQAQRQRTASRLNAAVLSAQAQEQEAALPTLFRRLAWEQDELQHCQRVSFPRIDDYDVARPYGMCQAGGGGGAATPARGGGSGDTEDAVMADALHGA